MSYNLRMDVYSILVLTHIIGTALGVGAATLAEVFYLKAMRDGVVDPMESEFLRVLYTSMRIALVVLVVSGFGFFILYRVVGATELLYSPVLWAKLTIIGVLMVNAIALHAHKMPFAIGVAISITSWYAALTLGVMRGIDASYISIMLVYVVVVALAIPALAKIKTIYLRRHGIN